MSSITNALSDILRNSEHLKSILPKQKPLPIDDSTHTPLSIPPLQLPSADSILSNFRSSLPAKLLDRCASTLIESAEAAQRNYEMAYYCAPYSSTSPTQDRKAQKLRYIREHVYHCTIIRPMQNLLVLAQRRTMKINSEARDPSEPKLRTRFRQEYVPFLEQCFQLNAYPSNVERLRLARETKMSERQIEVWFQNHRNRARREGKVLRKADTSSYVHGAVSENHVSSDSSGYESESSSPSSDQETFSKVVDTTMQLCGPSKTIFNVKIPAHAFPTRYSEGRSMDKDIRLEFSANDFWMRRPTNVPPAVHEPIKLDELIILFSKRLTIQDTTARRARKHDQPSMDTSKRSANPWYTATTTFVPRAPLFALVKPQAKPNCSPVKLASSKYAPILRSPHPVVEDANNTTAHLPQSYLCSRPRASSLSSGSADESSCNEPITPSSSPAPSLEADPPFITMMSVDTSQIRRPYCFWTNGVAETREPQASQWTMWTNNENSARTNIIEITPL
ncbi:hypothetical protein F5887DRAFT_1069937 [Amanita rubescens]|nr:hypothetical protein F5887DRAFT_1069937 [Amanita rubescens]